jgi:hypothetical protein
MRDTLEAVKALAPDCGIVIKHELWYRKCTDSTEETFVIYAFTKERSCRYGAGSLDEALEKLKAGLRERE